MRMKFSLSVFLVVLSSIRSLAVQVNEASLPAADDHRALLNDRWPPKEILNRRHSEWAYRGSATSSQYRKGTNRAVGHRPKDDDEYYHDDHVDTEDYYYGPVDKSNGKRPSEQDFEYYDKIPKQTKKDRNSGKGKVGKSSKSDECTYYHYENEYETEIYPENEEYYEHETDYEYESDYDIDHHNGKGTRGGKGKGGKKKKKSSKSSKKTKVCTDPPFEAPPTISPAPTTFDEAPSEQPPSEPSSPSKPTPFTPSPTSEDSIGVTLPAFSLAYDVPNLRQPTREELNALEAATSLYLENFFFEEFDGNSFTVLDDFITELMEASFVQGLPIEVDYLSAALFNPFSTILPSNTQLNSALVEAFTGVNILKYEVFLNEELSDDNVFIGSTIVFLQDLGGEEATDPTRSGIGITGITAAAVAFTLLVAGLVIYKRRHDGRDSEMDKLNKADGTVAGETFTGETYDGNASMSASSVEYARRFQDEDETSKTVGNLGTIPESDNDENAPPEEWNGDNRAENDEKKAYAGFAGQSNSAFRNDATFEEVALQGPTYGGSNIMLDTLSSSQEESLPGKPGEEVPRLSATMRFSSSSSDDSMDGGSPSLASTLSIREGSRRRPRTVAEIEALLSADLGDEVDEASATSNAFGEEPSQRSTNRPRTVEEIESLLHADLEDDSVLELPFSDEDETIDAEEE